VTVNPPTPPALSHANLLLDRLPARDRARVLALCESVELKFDTVLYDVGAPTLHVYFPVEGFVSLLVPTQGHRGLEVSMVGREGMVGVHVAMGVSPAPLRALVQGAGRAWRLAAEPLHAELAAHPALRTMIDPYICLLMAQLARSANCLHQHEVGPRLARWLLMSQDRAEAKPLHVTQDFMAGMLGVRRVGVTQAAARLQRQGLISYHRGELVVSDRAGLEETACSCYDAERRDQAAAWLR
jgi:CRP-like cAMP-binding protein